MNLSLPSTTAPIAPETSALSTLGALPSPSSTNGTGALFSDVLAVAQVPTAPARAADTVSQPACSTFSTGVQSTTPGDPVAPWVKKESKTGDTSLPEDDDLITPGGPGSGKLDPGAALLAAAAAGGFQPPPILVEAPAATSEPTESPSFPSSLPRQIARLPAPSSGQETSGSCVFPENGIAPNSKPLSPLPEQIAFQTPLSPAGIDPAPSSQTDESTESQANTDFAANLGGNPSVNAPPNNIPVDDVGTPPSGSPDLLGILPTGAAPQSASDSIAQLAREEMSPTLSPGEFRESPTIIGDTQSFGAAKSPLITPWTSFTPPAGIGPEKNAAQATTRRPATEGEVQSNSGESPSDALLDPSKQQLKSDSPFVGISGAQSLVEMRKPAESSATGTTLPAFTTIAEATSAVSATAPNPGSPVTAPGLTDVPGSVDAARTLNREKANLRRAVTPDAAQQSPRHLSAQNPVALGAAGKPTESSAAIRPGSPAGAEVSGNATVGSVPASATATLSATRHPSQSASAAEPTMPHAVAAVQAALEAADRVHETGHSSVELKLSFGDDTRLAVRVELRDGAVHTTFRTDSADLRQALATQWRVAAPASFTTAPDRAVRVADPVFTTASGSPDASGTSTGGDANSRHAATPDSAPESFPRSTFRSAAAIAPSASTSSATLRPSTSVRLNTFA